MKTEQIVENAKEVFPLTKEAIQILAEKAIPILTSTGAGKDWNFNDRLCYIKGATEINALWQEKARWKYIKDEPVKPKDKPFYIVAKRGLVGDWNIYFIENQNDADFMKDLCTHWKEII